MNNIIKILIADDLEPILLYLEKIISDTPEFELVGKAKSGTELIEKVLEFKPDLVITDLEMPDGDGFYAISELNKRNVDTKYIVLTGSDNSLVICKSKDLGIMKVIKKPILDSAKFVQQIKTVVNTQKPALENFQNISKEIFSQKIEAKKEDTFIKRIIKKFFN